MREYLLLVGGSLHCYDHALALLADIRSMRITIGNLIIFKARFNGYDPINLETLRALAAMEADRLEALQHDA